MMTFTEAAVHVLRLVGKPLHYKEITDVAIEKDLLSHVGKSPEVTMGARLAAVVKKGGKENVLARVKPGVFALAEWGADVVEKGLQDRTPALDRMVAAEQAEAERVASEGPDESVSEAPPSEVSTVNLPVPSFDEESEDIGDDERARAELSAAATALFEPEDDDDEPILGPGSDADDEDDDKRRGRRRGRGRGRGREDDGLPSYTVSDASVAVVAEAKAEVRNRGEGRNRTDMRDRGERTESRDRGENRDRGEARNDGETSRRDNDDRNERDRARRGDRDRRDREDTLAADGDIPAMLENVLAGFRRSGAVPMKQLADAAQRRLGKDAAGDGNTLSWLAAVVRADNLRRQAAHERPRFRLLTGNRIALTEWGMDRDALQLEKNILSDLEKLRQLTRKQLLRRLNELPNRAGVELWMLLLERLGYTQFKSIRRPNAHVSELHWAAVQLTPGGEVPTAVVVRRDGRDIGRERVTELRGSLHHYGAAALGLLVTTGQIMSGAREEAGVPFATPVGFIDGAKVSSLCEQHGIGVVHHHVGLPSLDIELFESLRSGQ